MAITLNTNKVYASLQNMIISQETFGPGVRDLDGLYATRRVDGTLYGDKKLYISTDVLTSYKALPGVGTSDYNLLTQFRPTNPVVAEIVIDQFRQIPLTTDEYLTKQAFMNEGAFSEFNGVMHSWLNKTKEVYEHTKFTLDIVTGAEAKAKALTGISLANADMEGYDLLKWRAQELFRQIEDAVAELKEPSRDYNDNAFLRTYSIEDFDIVMPLGVMSSVRKHDLPFLFEGDAKPAIKEVHWKYFGTLVTTSGTTADATKRAAVEKIFTKAANANPLHLFPGDIVPKDYVYAANEIYTPKYSARPTLNGAFEVLLIGKQDFPVMSAFSVGTSFFNAQTLANNQYLTFGHNDVFDAHIGEYALLKVAVTVT